MTEPAAKYDAGQQEALPCPFCGGDNISSNEWIVDDDHAKKFDADEFSEVWAFECTDCLGAAPMKTWSTPRPGDEMATKARHMRALQIEYFRTRDPELLRQSKAAEREFDQLIGGFEQNDLFYQGAG